MKNLNALARLLGSWANLLPAKYRKAVYKSVKVLAGLATLALILLPFLPQFGVTLPENVRWDAVLTGLLAFLGHLADRNTTVDPAEVDVAEAPETGNPEPPSGL